jgi:hypothetical protein
MNRANVLLLKTVRVSGWLFLPVMLLFLLTGYSVSGQYGMGRLMDEQTAVALHRLGHGPLLLLLVTHTFPAAWLAMQRWGWIKPRSVHTPTGHPGTGS